MKLFWKHVIQHNRRNKLFHKCVSTWTPLATTFNHRPSQKFNFSLMREDSVIFVYHYYKNVGSCVRFSYYFRVYLENLNLLVSKGFIVGKRLLLEKVMI